MVTDKVIDQRTSRVRINSASWRIEKAADGNLIAHSPAWVVHQIFVWVGEQGRTCYWVASKLNEMKIPPPQRATWMPRTVIKIVNRRCYTGKADITPMGASPTPKNL
jgi:hypothetical protein